MALLSLENITVHYEGVYALSGVTAGIDQSELVAVMGPNGAGKSTLLKSIFGLAPIEHGAVSWKGGRVFPVAHEMIRRGIVYVPQGHRVFDSLSVLENLEIGAWTLVDRAQIRARVEELMDVFPMLKEKRLSRAGTLSGGQQQMLSLARGLMVTPSLLLLDEPTLGLSPKMVEEMLEQIVLIQKRFSPAMMIVEHNVKSLVRMVDRAVILDKGRVVRDETAPTRLLENNYLGRVLLGQGG